MVGPTRSFTRRPTQSRLISPSSAERGAIFIGVFVGGLIGPGLLVMDHDRPYRGIIVMVVSAVMILLAATKTRQSAP